MSLVHLTHSHLVEVSVRSLFYDLEKVSKLTLIVKSHQQTSQPVGGKLRWVEAAADGHLI